MEAVEHTVNRPIVIMDEPQKMEGEATEKVQYPYPQLWIG